MKPVLNAQHARIQKVFTRANPALPRFFVVVVVVVVLYEGKKDPNSIKSKPSSARQRNAIKWRFAGGAIMAQLGSFVIFQGVRTSIAKEPYIFVIFQEGSGPPAPPLPLWICP